VVKAEYKEVSIELAKASLAQFNDQYRALNEQHGAETDRRAQLEAAVATGEAGIERQKVKMVEREQELNKLQKQFNELINRIRQLESDKKLATQRVEHLKEREKNLRDFLSGAGGQSQKLDESIAFSGKQVAEETAALEKIKSELESLRNNVDDKREAFDHKKRTLEQMRNDLQQRQRSQFEAEKKVAVADTSVMNLQRSIKHVEEERAQRANQITQLNKEKKETEEKLAVKQQELKELVAKQDDVKGRILQSQEQLEGHRARLAEESRKLDSRRNEHDLLKSLVDSLEGYPDSIKFLKKNKEWDNSAPLLSDVFVVKNEYRTALENVLDNYLNYYIVANTVEAAKAVSLLDRNKKGKANFFVLDHLGAYAPPVTEGPKDAVAALDVVTVDPQYTELARRLLGHVYITNEGADITQLSTNNGDVLVQKNGKVIKGKYTLGGGSIGAFEGNKIGRAKNLERLAREILELTKATNELKQYIADTQKLITGFNLGLNDKAIEQARQDIFRLQNHIVNMGNKVENFEQLNQGGDKRVKEIQASLDNTQANIKSTRADLEKMTRGLADLNESIKNSEAEFRAVEVVFNEITQKYNQHNINNARQQSKIDSLKQELRFKENQLNDLKKQIAGNSEQLQTINTQLTDTEKQLHTGDSELYGLLARKEAEERILNEKDKAYYHDRNDIAGQEGRLNQTRREKEQAETLLNGIKDKLNTMKVKVAGLSERLLVEFKVKLDDILDQERKGTETIEELTADVEKMKKRLENMGEINPTAIEAYTEIKVRNDFIIEQRDDLVNAKESLLSTIQEVENTANAKFSETFNLVRENFVQVFKALFTAEDNCDLRLTDPDNLADSNIEIYAQPKGKKPSTLTQLSGGEKTLTSTAFLFAIYLIKPAPFCILDEVDAPLDDANVGKFTQMIRKFSDNSQFIIVTHNKQTMASVDVIYGVTMQEAGVSKLVPVDFRSLN
jgi:chromosome segregation protein